MHAPAACRCGCGDVAGAPAHRIADALAIDDLDAALTAGLLDGIACDGCTPACRASLRSARDARRTALAARDRFRAREARLVRIRAERAARRSQPAGAADGAGAQAPPLPPAAVAALERAMARAAGLRRR